MHNQHDYISEFKRLMVAVFRVLIPYSRYDYFLYVMLSCSVQNTQHTVVCVIVRPLSTVGYTSVVASVIHSRQRSN